MLYNEVTKDQVLVSLARRVPMKLWSENLLLTSPVPGVLVPTIKTQTTVRVEAIESTAQGFVADTVA
jgi:hypothetical protein